MKRIALVGDSDIAFWPKELFPSPGGENKTEWDRPLVSGHSGATLGEVLPHLRSALSKLQNEKPRNGTPTETQDTLVVVACAGENDIGEGLSLEKSVEALREFLDILFRDDNDGDKDRFLLFLGPKFEPWLEDDPSYKKRYSGMARAFGRCLQEYESTEGRRIHFVDCLTMFCGETANVPGARLAGRARADPGYFASDQLHLNEKGYKVWKDVIESTIQQIGF